jgi:hypothetical protein
MATLGDRVTAMERTVATVRTQLAAESKRIDLLTARIAANEVSDDARDALGKAFNHYTESLTAQLQASSVEQQFELLAALEQAIQAAQG